MPNNYYGDKEGRYPFRTTTIETVDGAVIDYFDKKLDLQVDGANERQKVSVIFAGHERWAQIRKNRFRDENGVLILPILSVRRLDFERANYLGGMTSAQREITISKSLHPKTSIHGSLHTSRRTSGFLSVPKKATPIYETLTIPFPDFCEVLYEVVIWSQYNTQMNEIIEHIFNDFENAGGRVDTFVMPVDYDRATPKGNGYYFVGIPDGVMTKRSNDDDFTDQERLVRYSYRFKVPAYFILDPKNKPLSYGQDGEGNEVVYKRQSLNQVSLSEQILTLEEFEKLFG